MSVDEERRARERRVRAAVFQLSSLLNHDKYFWIDELDGVAKQYPYRHILEIFVRVNSGGTKLTAGDLMFAAMKEGWEDVETRAEQTLSGHVARFVIFGSFVTNKVDPNDVDIFLLMADTFDAAHLTLRHLPALRPCRRAGALRNQRVLAAAPGRVAR